MKRAVFRYVHGKESFAVAKSVEGVDKDWKVRTGGSGDENNGTNTLFILGV